MPTAWIGSVSDEDWSEATDADTVPIPAHEEESMKALTPHLNSPNGTMLISVTGSMVFAG